MTDVSAARAALPPAWRPPQVNVLSTLEEVRRATNLVAASAQRLMSLYTPDLEAELYDDPDFLEILKRFLLGRSFAKVRVLLGEGSRMKRDSHRFVALSLRLSSYIEVRPLGDDKPNPCPGFLIADERAIVHRANAAQWEGVADLDNPAAARVHLADFDAQWMAHAPDYLARLSRV